MWGRGPQSVDHELPASEFPGTGNGSFKSAQFWDPTSNYLSQISGDGAWESAL